MRFRHGDPLDDLRRYEQEQEDMLRRLPTCDECTKRITEDYYFEIEGEILCTACVISRYRRNTNDY